MAIVPHQTTIAGCPFNRHRGVEPPGIIAKLFRRVNGRDAAWAIENLFSARAPTEVAGPEVSSLLDRFGFRGERARPILRGVFAGAFAAFIADNEIADAEAAYLAALQLALGLSDREVADVVDEGVRPAFAALVDGLLHGLPIPGAAQEKVNALQARMKLSDETTARIYQSVSKAVVQTKYRDLIASRRVSDLDLKAVGELEIRLGMPVTISPDVRAQFSRLHQLWEVENGRLPVIACDIALKRDEICHFSAPCSYREIRSQTVRVDYGGFSGSFKIVKGVRYRAGSLNLHRVKQDVLTEIDTGIVYFTTRRILFRGEKGNKAIPLGSVLAAHLFADALQIEKASGKSPYLFINGDIEFAGVVMSALIGS